MKKKLIETNSKKTTGGELAIKAELGIMYWHNGPGTEGVESRMALRPIYPKRGP